MTALLVLILRVALAIALYVFLGRVLLTLWQDLKQQGEFLSSQKKPGIHIHAVMDNGKDIQHRFVQAEVTIGRDPNCDLPIIDEAISAHHARISYHHSQWWLEDLGSTNGTFIGKTQVMVPTVLITSDQFKCGGTTFTVLVDTAIGKLSRQ
jgi:pSer/pThr/pTyr-binding forkhead associated (FHA) protein